MPNSSNNNFFLHLLKGLRRQPAKPCFLPSDTEPEGLLYQQLEQRVLNSHALFHQLGLTQGDRVLVLVNKSPMAVILYLACLRAGLVMVPLNPACTDEELQYFLDNAQPALCIIDPKRQVVQEKHPDQYARLLTHAQVLTLGNKTGSFFQALNEISNDHPQPECSHCDTKDTAVIIYTSGTTGKPKGAMLSHGNLAANAYTLSKLWDWKGSDILIHALPIFHVHGLFVALHLALMNGSSMHFLEFFKLKNVLQELSNSSVFMGVPTHYRRLLDSPELSNKTCESMRLFISGSAPLLPTTFLEFTERTGHTILERYGMSETGMLCSNPLQEGRIAGSVGHPLPDVQVRIRDQKNRLINDHSIGVLEVKGPNVFSGYWQMPEHTQQAFNEDYFVTGDLVQQDRTGRICIVGRDRDLVISGGLNVYPKEIESVIDAIEGVHESAVIGLPHADFGEGVAAVICLAKESRTSEKIIFSHLKKQLSSYKIPKKLIFVDCLPRNTMGKVQKASLRRQWQDFFTR